MLEKRRRAVQFSKAGLEMPHSDQPFKSQDSDDASCKMESDLSKIRSRQEFDKIDTVRPRMVQREVLNNASISLGSSLEVVCSTGLGVISIHSPTLPAKEVLRRNMIHLCKIGEILHQHQVLLMTIKTSSQRYISCSLACTMV